MAALLLGMVIISGCTASQVNSAVTKIASYLPTAISLTTEGLAIYTAIEGTDTTNVAISNALTTIKNDLGNLTTLTTSYTSASSSATKTTAWSNIETLTDTMANDADSVLALASVKNTDSKAAGVIVISTLDAAIHVLDAIVSSTQSSNVVQAKLAKRTYKLANIETKWSPSDKQMIANAAGYPYPIVLHYAELQGF